MPGLPLATSKGADRGKQEEGSLRDAAKQSSHSSSGDIQMACSCTQGHFPKMAMTQFPILHVLKPWHTPAKGYGLVLLPLNLDGFVTCSYPTESGRRDTTCAGPEKMTAGWSPEAAML